MARKYLFELPYELSGIAAGIGMGQLKGEGVWDDIPEDLQQKLEAGSGIFGGVTITAEDLDEIDDDTLTTILDKLKLKWKEVPDNG